MTSLLIVAMSLASVGCSATPSWLASATEKVPYLGKGKSEAGLRLNGGPDFSQSYEELAAAHQQRNVVAPAIGLDGDLEPGRTAKFTNAVARNPVVKTVSTAFKSAKNKATDVAMPRQGPVPDAVSMATEVGEPTPELFLAAARMHEKSGDLAGAMAHYQRALVVDPVNLAGLLGSAHLLDRQGRLGEAIALYQEAARHHPNEAAPRNDLGLCLARQNKLPEAVNALQEAVTRQPNRKLYRNNVATVLVELGRVDEALAHLASVHGQAVAHHNVGFLLHKMGDQDSAARHFATAARLDSSLAAGGTTVDEARPQSQPFSPDPLHASSPPSVAGPFAQPVATATAAPRYPSHALPAAADAAASASDGPVNLPEWSQAPDRPLHAAAPPSPDQIGSYQPIGPDPTQVGPAPKDLLRHLPPVDPSYIPPSRY